MQFLKELLIFIVSSAYIVFLIQITRSTSALQKGLTLILLLLILIFFLYVRQSRKGSSTGFNKLLVIFWSTISVQLLVLSTGGLQSPFFILIYFFIIGLSFLFSFSVSLLFLFSCLIILFAGLVTNNNLLITNFHDPRQTILQTISFIVILPIAYLISKHYHLKDSLMQALKIKIKTTESILEKLPELIIVTDQKFRILSTNDVAARTLQRSSFELLDKPLFDILLLKDMNNKLVTAKTFFPDETLVPHHNGETFTFMHTSLSNRFVTINVQTFSNPSENLIQICFIINFGKDQNTSFIFDKARTKYEALSEHIKQKLSLRGMNDIKTDIMLLEKIEQDAYTLQNLNQILERKSPTYIDLAKLCQQIVLFNKGFSEGLGVKTKFLLKNFGAKDIAPLTVEHYHVNPEQLTGPFFTIFADAKQVEIIIKKLFDISILLASTHAGSDVSLTIERTETDEIIISIEGTSSPFSQEQIPYLFGVNYEGLTQELKLQMGSGLEGFLAKSIADSAGIKISMNYMKDNSKLRFTLLCKRK